jgi:AraC-like DNA-binding protein
MDLLSRSLTNTRLNSAVLAVHDLSAPWGIDFEEGRGIPCHYVLEGECWLLRGDEAPERLVAGDLVMLPHWQWHALTSDPGTPQLQIRTLIASAGVQVDDPLGLPDVPVRLSLGGGGARCRLMGMVFRTSAQTLGPLLQGLPERIVIPAADEAMAGLLAPAVGFILAEAEHHHPGYSVVSHRLAEVLLMHIIRAHLLLAPEQTSGALRGLSDPAIARALAAMHSEPARAWTVASLAAACGLSRSVFAERFRALTGTTPRQHLGQVRMALAQESLAAGETVKAVAAALGYDSAFGFAEAFKRSFGRPPSSFRPRRP